MAKRRRKSLNRRRHGTSRAASRKRPGVILGALIEGNKAVLEVLDKHGVTFCAGCFITLFSSPEKAAAYHAVPDVKAFLRDLRAAAGSPRR
jgi:hypothetical protein